MSHPIPGRRSVAEALRAGRALEQLVLAEGARELEALAEAARAAGVPVRSAPPRELDRLAAGVAHQGAVGLAPAAPSARLDDVADSRLLVALDGVTDPQNVGAVARSAEAAGAGGLLLRSRRSAPVTAAVEKAAAGALSWLPVVTVTNLVRALAALAERGCWSVGLAGDAEQSLWECGLLDEAVVLVLGAEGGGLSRLVAERVDARVAIPLQGRVGALNVAAAAAVALFEIARRSAQPGR